MRACILVVLMRVSCEFGRAWLDDVDMDTACDDFDEIQEPEFGICDSCGQAASFRGSRKFCNGLHCPVRCEAHCRKCRLRRESLILSAFDFCLPPNAPMNPADETQASHSDGSMLLLRVLRIESLAATSNTTNFGTHVM